MSIYAARIVQKFDLEGRQKVKGLVRVGSNQPITWSDQRQLCKSASYVAIVRAFAEFEGEELAIRKGEKAHEEESKAGRGCQFIELSWLGSVQWRNPKVIVDDATQNLTFSDKPFGQRFRSFDRWLLVENLMRTAPVVIV